MSFEGRASPLPPFGIRELYESRTGILHISQSQYESTVSSYPDAVLTYVDDDDGEVITVGSGLELQQRLSDPVMVAKRRHNGRIGGSASGTSALRGSIDDSMVHLFDIQHSERVLAIWRHHEAYSSKIQHGDLSSDSDATSPDLQQPNPVHVEDAPVQSASDAELLDPKPEVHPPSLPLSRAENTSMPLETAAGVKPSSTDLLRDFDTVLSAACKGLESLGLADLLDNTAQALHSLAQKTRDADTSPVETLLGGFKDVVTDFGKLGLEILEDLDRVASPASSSPHTAPPSTHNEKLVCKCAMKTEAKLAKKVTKIALKDAKAAAKEQRREEKRARRLERVTQREARRNLKNHTTEETPATKPEEDTEINNEGQGKDECTAVLSADEQVKLSNPNPQDEIKEATPTLSGASQRGPGPQCEMDLKLKHDLLLSAPTLSLPPTLDRSGPTRPMLSQAASNLPCSNIPTSIMDIESSNPDFTARYPPLTSLRQTHSVGELLKKNFDAGPSNIIPKPKVASSTRHSKVGQLEDSKKERLSSVEDQVSTMQADMLRRRSQLKSDSLSLNSRPQSAELAGRYEPVPHCLFPSSSLPPARASVSASRPLPGSWPEMGFDQTNTGLVTESSGAFFNRMAGIQSSGVAPKRALSPVDSCNAAGAPADQNFPSTGLRRAQTVTSSERAAKVTRPSIRIPSPPRYGQPYELSRSREHTDPLPQRSFSLQQRHQINPTVHEGRKDMPTLGFRKSDQSWGVPRKSFETVLTQRHPPAPPAPPAPLAPWTPFHARNTAENRPLAPSRIVPGWSGEIDGCVRTLATMGYGVQANEAARLPIYASATGGNVNEAIDMIEEDRKAAEAFKSS